MITCSLLEWLTRFCSY